MSPALMMGCLPFPFMSCVDLVSPWFECELPKSRAYAFLLFSFFGQGKISMWFKVEKVQNVHRDQALQSTQGQLVGPSWLCFLLKIFYACVNNYQYLFICFCIFFSFFKFWHIQTVECFALFTLQDGCAVYSLDNTFPLRYSYIKSFLFLMVVQCSIIQIYQNLFSHVPSDVLLNLI